LRRGILSHIPRAACARAIEGPWGRLFVPAFHYDPRAPWRSVTRALGQRATAAR
jgi:hypothetical protein